MKRRRKLVVAAGLFSVVPIALVIVYLAFPRVLLRGLVALQRANAGFEHQSMEVHQWTLPWIEAGPEDVGKPEDAGKPETILLLHGFGDSKDSFIDFAAEWSDSYRIVALDLPGFGETAVRMDEHYDADLYVRVILEFVDQLEVDSVHLIGYSMGGMLAAKAAAASPGRIRTLTLLAPAGMAGTQPSQMERMMNKGNGNPLTYRDRAGFDQLMQLNFNQRVDLPEFICRAAVAQGRERAELHELIFNRLFDPENAIHFEQEVAGLQMPTLLIWGTEDRILDVSAADHWLRVKPDIRLEIIPHVGHDLVRQRIDKLHDLLEAHLKR